MKQNYRIPEACEELAIGRSLLYRLIATGELKAIKIAGATRIPKSSMEAFLAECESRSTELRQERSS